MIFYLWQRISKLFLAMATVSATAIIFKPYIIRLDLTLFVILGIFTIGIVAGKTNWYLLLPYSRSKLFFWNMMEALALASLASLCSLVVLLIYGNFGALRAKYIFVLLGLFLIVILARALFPFSNRQKVSGNQLSFENIDIKRNFGVVFFALSLAVFKDEGWYLVSLGIALLTFAPYGFFVMLTMPSRSLKKIFNKSLGTAILMTLLLFGIAIFGVYRSISGELVDYSLSYLGHIPVSLSTERVHGILALPEVSSAPILKNAIADGRLSLTFEEWTERTSKCRKDDCIELSNELVPRVSIEDRFSLFSELMKKCESILLKDASFKCYGPHLKRESLDEWLRQLVETNAVDKWLSSDSVKEQFIAIRSLSYEGANEQRLIKIKDLRNSRYKSVQQAAAFYVEIYYPQQIAKLEKCKAEPAGKLSCKTESAADLF